jgi:hypothetical protein
MFFTDCYLTHSSKGKQLFSFKSHICYVINCAKGLKPTSVVVSDENEYDNTIVLTSILRQELHAWGL